MLPEAGSRTQLAKEFSAGNIKKEREGEEESSLSEEEDNPRPLAEFLSMDSFFLSRAFFNLHVAHLPEVPQ